MPRIIRVFPRKTKATPDDELVRINCLPTMFDVACEVHVSVVFSWDLPRAEYLAKQWSVVAPVKIGGPATGEAGGDFVPGMYVKKGYVLTSRGCPNRCWFCSVWRREGAGIRELPLTEGYNLLDDNILANNPERIKQVFAMLQEGKRQYKQRIEFTGGLEAAKLEQWHVDELRKLSPKQMFFAYDTPDDLEPLQRAGRMLLAAGWTTVSHTLRAYVLCGWKNDTFEAADRRMHETLDAGFMPMAMLYRDSSGKRDSVWSKWQRKWARPAIISQAV